MMIISLLRSSIFFTDSQPQASLRVTNMAAPLKHIFPTQNCKNSASATDLCNPQKRSSLSESTLLISGKHRMLMTSLLQQAAVSYSVEYKHTVYIRPEPLTKLPLSIHGMYQMGYATIQNIRYMYMDNVEEVVTYLSGMNNNKAEVPKAIIIDGLDFYISQLQYNSEVSICKLCSQLMDSIQYLNERHCETVPLLVSISDTLSPHLTVYRRYFDVYSLTQEAGKEGTQSYTLERLGEAAKDAIYRYKLTLTDSICLESVEISHDSRECTDSV